jgi:hypothetical protein
MSFPRARRAALAASVASVVVIGGIQHHAVAAPLIGSVVVERSGGTSGFGAAGATTPNTTDIFLDAFSPLSQSYLQTITLPSTDPDGAGSQRAITDVGDRDGGPGAQDNARVGLLSASVDGSYLVTGGYQLPTGIASPQTIDTVASAEANTPAPRVIARINTATGAVDTSTALNLTNSTNPGSVRSVATVNGSNFYLQGSSGTMGARFVPTFGVENASTAVTNRINGDSNRSVRIAGGQLYVASTSSNAPAAVSVVNPSGGGLPGGTATTFTALPGLPASSTVSSGQFVLLDRAAGVGFNGTDLDTLYLADLSQASGGVQKYSFDGSTWALQYTLSAGLTASNTDTLSRGIIGLDYYADELGNPVLYATTMGTATQNALVRVVDAGAASPFTLVSNSPANTRFRGVAVVVPEPGTFSLAALTFGGWCLRRRRAARAE